MMEKLLEVINITADNGNKGASLCIYRVGLAKKCVA